MVWVGEEVYSRDFSSIQVKSARLDSYKERFFPGWVSNKNTIMGACLLLISSLLALMDRQRHYSCFSSIKEFEGLLVSPYVRTRVVNSLYTFPDTQVEIYVHKNTI